MNYVAASLILQVLSAVSVQMDGIIFSSMLAVPIILTRSDMFSISDTITSVLLFFSRIETIGIKCYAASSYVRLVAKAQTECAILPFTCWLDSVASYNFSDGNIFCTIKWDEQFLASKGSLAAASLLTSGSESPRRAT